MVSQMLQMMKLIMHLRKHKLMILYKAYKIRKILMLDMEGDSFLVDKSKELLLPELLLEILKYLSWIKQHQLLIGKMRG